MQPPSTDHTAPRHSAIAQTVPSSAVQEDLDEPGQDDDCLESQSDPSAYLDLIETNSQLPAQVLIEHERDPDRHSRIPFTSHLEAFFRHSGWARRRNLTWTALVATSQPESRLAAFANCGAQLRIQENLTTHDVRCVCFACHDRLCRPCANSRAALVATNLRRHVGDRRLLFITLTLRHGRTPLLDQIKRLRASFNALRRRNVWTENIDGGAAFLQTKVSDKDGLWHPHLHILADGGYIPQKQLSEAWHSITGDSTIVDIQRPQGTNAVRHYLTAYVTNPADPSVFQHPEMLLELVVAMRGQRLCFTFGTWRGFALEERPPIDGTWYGCGSIASIVYSAASQLPAAQRILTAVCRKYPGLAAALMAQPPPEQPTAAPAAAPEPTDPPEMSLPEAWT